MQQRWTYKEVAEHNSQKDLWIVIEKKVYDVTAFQKQHPGGAAVLLQMAGRDATDAARAAHKDSSKPTEQMAEFCVGDVVGESKPGQVHPVGEKVKSGAAANGRQATTVKRTGSQIDAESFDELKLSADTVQQVQASWSAFCSASSSLAEAGEAIYESIFENMPGLQGLFLTPRAVQAMRFSYSLDGLVRVVDNPAELKGMVETVGFQHLNLDVTEARVAVFRDAVVDVLSMQLAENFTDLAREGWLWLLNYVGGAIIYIKANYVDRLRILADSWRTVNPKDEGGRHSLSFELEDKKRGPSRKTVRKGSDEKKKGSEPTSPSARSAGSSGGEEDSGNEGAHAVGEGGFKKPSKRTTFNEMFEVNAAVMGFRNSTWMREVLNSFDALVTHVADSPRLMEECDILVLRLDKRGANVNLAQFKACMMASLRSLLPKEWDSSYEVAWNWLWDNVEQLLKRQLGKPLLLEKALETLLSGLDEDTKYELGQDIFTRFFESAPAGQEHLKQSDMRLHFIAEQVNALSLSLFRDPWKIVDDVTALGLRHVGYGIPTELVGPFVTEYISAMMGVTKDTATIDAYRWSLGLISRMFMRTINEGSTIVMKAVNANSTKQLKKAVGSAPRKSRASWLLKVEAGSQSISPLQWSIESGCFETAEAIFQDLLTIRADRERYYYGVDDLFGRHPDIIHMLCVDAPQLLPTLLEGLIWRSSQPEGRVRRVNYYIKHLLVKTDGSFSDTLQWLTEAGDPKILAHEVIVLVSDTLWTGIVRPLFISSKIYFILSLVNFMLGQAILPKLASSDTEIIRIIILVCRCINYFVTMLRLIVLHTKRFAQEYREGETMKVFRCIPVPQYLSDPYDSGSVCFVILLLLMLTHEPYIHCITQDDVEWPTATCEAANGVRFMYSVFAMGAMILHWFLLIDLAVFSTGLSIFLLVIGQVLSEIWRFIFALVFLLLTFGSAVSVLDHNYYEMRDIPRSVVALFAITLKLYEDDYRDLQPEPALLGAVFMFVTASVIILLNLLVAQLNCSYVMIYQDMVGFARLNRAKVIVEMMETCPEAKWDKFVASLKLDEPLEFNQGDVGLDGGIQATEPATLHVVVSDRVFRFGGSVSQDMQWPEEEELQETEKDGYYRLEKLVSKTLRKIVKLNQSEQKRSAPQTDERSDGSD